MKRGKTSWADQAAGVAEVASAEAFPEASPAAAVLPADFQAASAADAAAAEVSEEGAAAEEASAAVSAARSL